MNPSAAPTLATLINSPMRPGRLGWIGLRSARRQSVLVVQSARAIVGQGLEGDRYSSKTQGKRQLTLIQAEHLVAIASHLGEDNVDPAQMRRNLVTEGINLLALKGKCFRIGSVVCEYSGECHPCSRMEEYFGPGGYNAVRGLGGITAKVIEEGVINVGDAIEVNWA